MTPKTVFAVAGLALAAALPAQAHADPTPAGTAVLKPALAHAGDLQLAIAGTVRKQNGTSSNANTGTQGQKPPGRTK
jgi:hypothetical protein